MSKRHIGQCGNCGGNVSVETVFLSVNPPVPTCESCGATARPQGPVIEMNRAAFVDRDETYRNGKPGGWSLGTARGS